MFQLTLKHIIDRACRYYPRKEIVSVTHDKQIFRYDYNRLRRRICKIANVLRNRFDVREGERVGVLCWNNHRNLELHFAVPCSGAILHTVNVRFLSEQLVSTVNLANDKVLFFDPDLAQVVSEIASRLKTVRHFVICDESRDRIFDFALNYERLVDQERDSFVFPELNENSPAAVCFTTGTTGLPKAVVYSHRGIFLNAMTKCMIDTVGLSEKDVLLHAVPMYHISGWFMPYASSLVGAKQVFPGARPTTQQLYSLIIDEHVTVSGGVPTVWQSFLDYLEDNGKQTNELHRLVIGGAAPSEALISKFAKFDIEVIHAWGMTETYDAATFSFIKSYMPTRNIEEKSRIIKKQGLPAPCVELNAIDEEGKSIRWDANQKGELIIRGAFVIENYFSQSKFDLNCFFDGWLRTGDIVTIDDEGYIEIVDRQKDLIRSGGESISSIALENKIMAHPLVQEACIVAVPDKNWGERPLALVVPKAKNTLGKQELLSFLAQDFPKWWLPSDIVFTDVIPKTSVGKFDKKVVRMKFGLPSNP